MRAKMRSMAQPQKAASAMTAWPSVSTRGEPDCAPDRTMACSAGGEGLAQATVQLLLRSHCRPELPFLVGGEACRVCGCGEGCETAKTQATQTQRQGDEGIALRAEVASEQAECLQDT